MEVWLLSIVVFCLWYTARSCQNYLPPLHFPNLGIDFSLMWWAKMFSNLFIHFWLLINRINSSISHFQLGKWCYFFLSGKRSWGVIFFATSIRLKAIPCLSNAACLHPVVHPLFIWSLSQDACGVSTARLAGRRLPWKRALLAKPGRMVLFIF